MADTRKRVTPGSRWVALALPLLALGAVLARGEADVQAATGTIQFAQNAYTVVEGDGPQGNTVTVELTFQGPSPAGAYARVTQTGGTADGSDWQEATYTPLFQAGGASQFLSVKTHGDTTEENDETIILTVDCIVAVPGDDPCGGATIGSPNVVTITIIDDDGPPRYSFGAASYAFDESAGTVSVPVVRAGDPSTAGSVQCVVEGGSATEGPSADFTFGSAQTLTFAPGQTARNCTFTIIENFAIEADETVFLGLQNPEPPGATIVPPDTVTVTIEDNDGPGTLGFQVTGAEVNEDAGSITLTVTRSAGATGTVTVDFSTSELTADAAVDYATESGTLSFGQGILTRQITVDILDDAAVEGDETFKVVLFDVDGGASLDPARDEVTVTINDDESAGTFQFATASITAGEPAGSATVTVTRSGGTTGAASVSYEAEAGTATAGLDFTAVAGTLNFASGQASASFQVPILNDAFAEGNETVLLSLSSPTAGTSLGNPAEAVLTIVDDESTVPLVLDVSPSQGGSTGGTIVTITGVNFTGATSVSFGAVSTSNIVVVDSTEIVVVAPAGAPGTVDVRVTTPAGQSPITDDAKFTYRTVPVITSIAPNNGPAEGGTSVLITGTGFSGATRVLFGAEDAASFIIHSPTQITAVSPPGTLGSEVQVRVVNANGSSPTSGATEFRYRGPEEILEYDLYFRWTLRTWSGQDGMDAEAALRSLENPDNPQTTGVYSVVSAVYHWNGSSWEAYFPGQEHIPGANDLETFEYGEAYWIAITVPSATWEVVEGP